MTITVSADRKIVIPKDATEEMGLKAGQVVEVVKVAGVIQLVPHRSLDSLRGVLRGVDVSDYREETDEERY